MADDKNDAVNPADAWIQHPLIGVSLRQFTLPTLPTPPTLLNIEIHPEDPLVAADPNGGPLVQFSAIGKFSDHSSDEVTKSVDWNSSAPNLVDFATGVAGLARVKSAGTATITAKDAKTNVPASTKITVALPGKKPALKSITVNPPNETFQGFLPRQFTAMGHFSVVEVAASSASLDAREKLASYRRAGVREYLLWRTEDEALNWWVLEEDEYRPMQAGSDGILRSRLSRALA